ncbi:hypothetical protein [Streptomyces sp. KR80]|uniref:hypothetical protein n=1 Tax=Streptomyces sp. KR80 TaxID=3457426 RepID=UPI003FCFCE93
MGSFPSSPATQITATAIPSGPDPFDGVPLTDPTAEHPSRLEKLIAHGITLAERS